jgi:hypothetical protein
MRRSGENKQIIDQGKEPGEKHARRFGKSAARRIKHDSATSQD